MHTLPTRMVIKKKTRVIDFRKIYYSTWKFFPLQVFHENFFKIKEILRLYQNPSQNNIFPVDSLEALIFKENLERNYTELALKQILENKKEWEKNYLSSLQDFTMQYEIAFGCEAYKPSILPENFEVFQQAKASFFYQHMLPDFHNQMLYDLQDICDLLVKNGFENIARDWCENTFPSLKNIFESNKRLKVFEKSY